MSLAPAQLNQRIQYLDVLRGIAISGVLFAFAFWNLGTESTANWTSFDKILNEVGAFLVDSKCYTTLACLFTIGFVLHMNKTGDEARSLYTYRRRLLGLLIIGAFHALLLRNGDILAPYAILTFIAILFYKASNKTMAIALVIVFPLGYSFWLSLNNFDLSVGADYEFVGAKNYVEGVFKDPRFLGSVWNTAVIIAPSIVAELLLGLLLALLLSRVARGRPIITALLAIPCFGAPPVCFIVCFLPG